MIDLESEPLSDIVDLSRENIIGLVKLEFLGDIPQRGPLDELLRGTGVLAIYFYHGRVILLQNRQPGLDMRPFPTIH